MSTSALGGTVLYDPTEFGADRFVDTGMVRDGVLNSAMHRADSAAQPVIAWSAPDAAVWTDDSTPYLVPVDLDGVDWWRRFPIYGVYVPKIRANGAPYRLRVAIAGRSSSGDSVSFAVTATEWSWAGWGWSGVETDQKITYSAITSTTVAELTDDGGTGYLDPGRTAVDQAIVEWTWSTLTDIGGDAIALRAPLLSVQVFGKTASLASDPELYAVSVHEVIGT